MIRWGGLVAVMLVAQQSFAYSSSESLYEKSSQITENLHYYEHLLTEPQAKEINALLDRIDFVYHTPVETCGSPRDVFKSAYIWASAFDGLYYSSSKAEAFADNMSKKTCPALYLSTFKQSYTYAESFSGLAKFKSAALVFAEMISEHEQKHFYPQNTLACYKEQYEFAYSFGGLNKSRSESEKFAKLMCLPS